MGQHDRHEQEINKVRQKNTRQVKTTQDVKLKLHAVKNQIQQTEKVNLCTITKAQFLDVKENDDASKVINVEISDSRNGFNFE